MSDARTVIADFLSGLIFSSKPQELNAEDLLAALAEAGLVVVPRVPTKNMIATGAIKSLLTERHAQRVWDVMMEAANEQ